MMELSTAINSKGEIVDEGLFREGLKYFAGKRVIISIKDFEEIRSVDQNSGLWRWNDLLSKYTGHTPNEIHYAMLGEIFGWKEIKFTEEKYVSVPQKTTKNMTTKEFSDYIILYFNKAFELFEYQLPPFGWE